MPDSPSPDRVTTELAAIRERQHLASDASLGFARIEERHTALIRVAYEDTPRLLAAVEAVLAPHQPGCAVILGALCPRHEAHRFFSVTADEAADVAACPDCTATVYVSCAGCAGRIPLDSCPGRRVITAELTGEDAGNGDRS